MLTEADIYDWFQNNPADNGTTPTSVAFATIVGVVGRPVNVESYGDGMLSLDVTVKDLVAAAVTVEGLKSLVGCNIYPQMGTYGRLAMYV